MEILYQIQEILVKLKEKLGAYFSEETVPTRQHYIELALSILALNGFQSVKLNYEHFICDISQYGLKSFYYTLKKGKTDLKHWMMYTIEVVLSVITVTVGKQPIVLSIDDTMVEKSGQKFEYCAKLFDHASHNGSNYLNGHCYVSLLLSVPVQDKSGKRYLSIPVAHRMWTKEQTKLEMAAELARIAMRIIGSTRQVFLCCDSWYPKGPVLELVDEFGNLDLICNVRSDTAIYALPPKRTGKRGRPKVFGQRLSLTDFILTEINGTNYCVGSQTVLTRIFGKRVVYAIVTKARNGKSFRLFLCTKKPESIDFDIDFLRNNTAQAYALADTAFLPLAIYSLRWNIEVVFYELKTFWALGDYMLRSKDGIERLLNLISIVYGLTILLPWKDPVFARFKDYSPQQIRFLLGSYIQQHRFFASFVSSLENDINTLSLALPLKSLLAGLFPVA